MRRASPPFAWWARAARIRRSGCASEQQAFRGAMAKEWSVFNVLGATKYLSTQRLAALQAPMARLVVVRCQATVQNLRSDAPTGSHLAFHIVHTFAAQTGWTASSFKCKERGNSVTGGRAFVIATLTCLRPAARHSTKSSGDSFRRPMRQKRRRQIIPRACSQHLRASWFRREPPREGSVLAARIVQRTAWHLHCDAQWQRRCSRSAALVLALPSRWPADLTGTTTESHDGTATHRPVSGSKDKVRLWTFLEDLNVATH